MVKQCHAIKCYFCIAENSFTYIFVSYRIYMLYGHWIPIENIVKIYIYKYICLFCIFVYNIFYPQDHIPFIVIISTAQHLTV